MVGGTAAKERDNMTAIEVYVRREIEVPDTVTIKGVTSTADYYDDVDFNEEEAYSYYLCHIDGDDISTNDVDYEIRIYEQCSFDNAFIAAVVNDEIVESCYVPATSESVTEMVYAYERYLNSI